MWLLFLSFDFFQIIGMAAAYTEQARQKEKLEEALQNVRQGKTDPSFSRYSQGSSKR